MKKTCKSLTAFVLVACLMAALAIPAMAAALDVSKFETQETETERYYKFVGVDYADALAEGKYLVINAVPTKADGGVGVVLESNIKWWDSQTAIDRIEGTDFWYVEISKFDAGHLVKADLTQLAIMITDWTLGDFVINSVEVTDTLPTAGAAEEPADTTSPKTGDNSLVFVAIALLLLAAPVAVVVTKKAKVK